MGYIKHHAIIVTGSNDDQIKEAHAKAKEIFKDAFKDDGVLIPGDQLVSEIIRGVANTYDSFFIAPDGSKGGWSTSDCGDNARKAFIEWMQGQRRNYCDFVELCFGGDDDNEHILVSRWI